MTNAKLKKIHRVSQTTLNFEQRTLPKVVNNSYKATSLARILSYLHKLGYQYGASGRYWVVRGHTVMKRAGGDGQSGAKWVKPVNPVFVLVLPLIVLQIINHRHDGKAARKTHQ